MLDSFDSFLLRPLIFCCCHLKFTWSQVVSGSWPKRRRRTTLVEQGSLYYQPKQCTIIREIPQNYHRSVLFDPPNMGNFMTPVETSTYWYCWLYKTQVSLVMTEQTSKKTWSGDIGGGFDVFDSFLAQKQCWCWYGISIQQHIAYNRMLKYTSS